ncbi:hypothetical protein L1887_62031 [Cichorium endivia]|nr:hypothetical protein L1887_62031 [Cichorium endivia]
MGSADCERHRRARGRVPTHQPDLSQCVGCSLGDSLSLSDAVGAASMPRADLKSIQFSSIALCCYVDPVALSEGVMRRRSMGGGGTCGRACCCACKAHRKRGRCTTDGVCCTLERYSAASTSGQDGTAARSMQ